MVNDMKKPKTKYTLRADGRIVRTEIIDGKRKYFYGRTDEEVDAKYAAYINPPVPANTLKTIAEAWWSKKESTLSPNTSGTSPTSQHRRSSASCSVSQLKAILRRSSTITVRSSA